MKLVKSEKYNNVFSYKTKKGAFYAFRYTFHDSLGKRHEKQQRGFTSELEAHKAELKVELLVAENDSQFLSDSEMTFSEMGRLYVKMNKKKWRPSYVERFDICLRKYIDPMIGNRKISKLNKMEYDYLYIQPQLDRNLSPYTVQQNHHYVMVILNAAVANDMIPRNRLHGIKIDFGQKKHRQALTESDLRLFNNQLKKESFPNEAFFITLEMTGMRKGEALALTWKDIDLKNNTISISKSRDKFGVGPTKTASGVRTIAIAKSLSTLLKKYKLQWSSSSRIAKQTKPNEFVFVGKFNGPLSWNTADYYFHQICNRAGIKQHYVIHSLRHTQATLLIANGVSPVDVAHRLGHANPAVTLEVYTHPTGEHDVACAEKFSEIVNI